MSVLARKRASAKANEKKVPPGRGEGPSSSSSSTSARRSSLLSKANVKGHLVKLGILTEKDRMRTERRLALDTAADEIQAKKVKDFTARFFNKVDDERNAIKIAFSQWRVDSSSTDLKLDGTQMTPAYLSVLEDVLEVGQYPFTSLHMRKCFLNDAEMGVIGPMLDNNNMITKVDWSSNAITDIGLVYIADMLEFNRVLEEIDLRENHLSAQCAPRLYQALRASPTLQKINTLPLRSIIEGHDLSTLSIPKQSLGALDAALLSLAFHDMQAPYALTSLDLSHNKLTYRAVDALVPGLEHLFGLKALDLSHNPIAMEGAEAVAYYLSSNKSLTCLRLASCGLCGPDGRCFYGVEALRDALKAHKALTELDLGGNQVKDSTDNQIRDSLRVNRSLTYDSSTRFDQMIASKLPPVPTFDHPPEAVYRPPPFDEKFLRREKYVMRTFVIEPEVEVVPKRKKKGGNDPSSNSTGLGGRMLVPQGVKDLLRGGQGVVTRAKGLFGTTAAPAPVASSSSSSVGGSTITGTPSIGTKR